MKKWIPAIFAFAMLQASALFAQTLTGTWQGSLQIPGRELRVVFKIATTDADMLKATMYSIDQGAVPITGMVTQQGSSMKIAIPAIGGTFEGKINGEGNSIAGNWTQGPMPMPLTLKRATPETAWTIPEPPPPPKPMPANANPSFEVATIKPSDPARPGKALVVRGREFVTINTTLTELITFAYELHPKQVTGGPSWMESQKYDLTAKPDVDGSPNTAQLRTMLRKLLAERFQLAFHHDKKELSVYTLNVSKTGAKITKKEGEPSGLPGLFFRGLGVLTVTNAAIQDFTNLMQSTVLDRPIVDQTGLQGRFDFTLKWTPDETQFGGQLGQIPAPVDKSDTPPDLFTAIQQQLGLQFEPMTVPTDVLVIDKVEKPSEN
ncbi:MAG TPA: TIGR03435 family protein [Bryobacteraceae bacterium]|nr:TIGR03435 family protein [Bryobacteraceae bacterium]